jgi:hypothetical protein
MRDFGRKFCAAADHFSKPYIVSFAMITRRCVISVAPAPVDCDGLDLAGSTRAAGLCIGYWFKRVQLGSGLYLLMAEFSGAGQVPSTSTLPQPGKNQWLAVVPQPPQR